MIVTQRLRPHVFRLPIEKIRSGYKSDIYFGRTKYVLEKDERRDRVTMQIFQKHSGAVIVGTDQTLALLHVGAGRYRDRVRAQRLFERYLDAEHRLYDVWLALPGLDWERYEPTAREVFEIARCASRASTPPSPTSRRCTSARSLRERRSRRTRATSWPRRAASP